MHDAQWIIPLTGARVPDKELIGGKAWSIARMRAAGLPVPPAFVITTSACRAYLEGGTFPAGLNEEIDAGIAYLEAETGRRFDAAGSPLLVSVRSGAALSMPGMMDTVLNLGINDRTESALALESGLPEFARDTHCRFIELYSSIVLKAALGDVDRGSRPADLRERVRASGHSVPESARAQLALAIEAVFGSWNGRRARRYREHHNISSALGTAVTVQAMVFGNLNDRSGTGVIFSRNPLSGDPTPFGEYLPRAQGEDVVSGRFTPQPLQAMKDKEPRAHAALLEAAAQLERQQGDIQDIEFTVQGGELFLLQARSAKRAPHAAVHAAVAMVEEGLIGIDTALTRVTPEQVLSLLLPRLQDGAAATADSIAKGEGACPGVASGVFVADSDEAERRAAQGEAVILVRPTTSPEDIHGMIAARAVVTEQGGSTSHAAVVSRALGRPCVVGIGESSGIRCGETGTLDGGAGLVYAGLLPVVAPREEQDPDLERLIGWARERSPVRVLRPAEASAADACLEIDAEKVASDPDGVPALLAGASAVRGSVLANPAFARRAADLGVKTIVTEPVLPVLLAILQRSP